MAAPATITVFDNLYDFAGNAIANAPVNCILNGSQETTSGGLISPKQQATTTDGNGRFAFTVVANDLLSPVNSTYTIITPFRTYDIAPQSANGSSQQTTAANVIVNTPSPLAPATSNITGNLTISGTLTVSGLITGQAGETISAGTFSIPIGGFTMAGPLTLTAAASQVIPGATSFSVRDTGNANDNLLVTNAGNVTARGSLTVTAGPLTVSAGGVTVTAGGLTVSAGGASITGNSTVTGTLTVTAALTVQAGGAAITGNSTVTGTLTVTSTSSLQGDVTAGARLLFSTAVAKIIPGATSVSIRNNSDNADNLLIPDNGRAVLRNGLALLGTAIDVGAGTLGYAQVTASQAGISAATDLTGLTVTVTVGSGRRIRLSAFVALSTSNGTNSAIITILESSTQLQGAGTEVLQSNGIGIVLSVVLTPTAGSHTYKLQGAVQSGAGTIGVQASATQPAYILCEDIGT